MTASSITSVPTWSGPSARAASGSSRSWPAQEFQWVFSAKNRSTKPGVVSFDFVKEDRRVGVYYFYVLDPDFGPGFIKICTYFPYPAQGVGQRPRVGQTPGRPRRDRLHRARPTGSPPATSPARLQAICDRFGPDDVAGVLRPLDARHPDPVHRGRPRRRLLVGAVDAPGRGLAARSCSTTPAGPAASSRRSSPTTSASAAPSRSRPCSPDQRGAGTPRPIPAPGSSARAPTSTSTSRYKHSRIKQYLKEGRALRIETVINKPSDIGVLRPARAPARARRQGPPGQRSSAYDRTCRPGLCHRLCALRAHPPALHTGGPTNRSPALRGSHAPWP